MESKFPLRLQAEPFLYTFEIPSDNVYFIPIVASCRSGKQVNKAGGEDLRVEIDGMNFREIPPVSRKQEYNIPPTWNGTHLEGQSKTVIFILYLRIGEHQISFIPYRGAIVKSEPVIKKIEDLDSVMVISESQAEDGDRRPWYAIALIDFPLKSLSIDATAKRRWRDSDDIKLVIDGHIKPNPSLLAILRRDWLIAGSLLMKLFKKERQQFTFKENLSKGIHYIEIWSDRRPVLHELKLDLGEFEYDDNASKRVPTVDDPKWTGSFTDDTDIMLLARLIFGEGESESREAKIWIGASVLNRAKMQTWWGKTAREVIQKPGQYDPFKPENDRFNVITDPFLGADPGTIESWYESYSVAQGLVSDEITIPTDATHFHGMGITRDWFIENVVPDGRFIRQIDNTHFYWSPN